MAAGLVEDDAAEAVVDDDRHLAGRAVLRGQHDDGDPGRLLSYGFRRGLLPELQALGSARLVAAALEVVALLGEGVGHDAGADPSVPDEPSLAVGDLHLLPDVQHGGVELHDPLVRGEARVVRPPQQSHLLLERRLLEPDLHRVVVLVFDAGQGDGRVLLSRADGAPEVVDDRQELRLFPAVRVAVDRLQALVQADAHAASLDAVYVLCFTVKHVDRFGDAGLFKDLGKVRLRLHAAAQISF